MDCQFIVWLMASLLATSPAFAQADPPSYDVPLGIALESYAYPYEVKMLPLENEGHPVRMAFMDVAPTGNANGRTALLMHGKNFVSDYWKSVIEALAKAGYRVVVPDQIGFGKSSKPEMRYSLDLLAGNTIKLLDSLGIDKIVLIGNSMGGTLAIRFASLYPSRVMHLVLENPIGLEDYHLAIPPQGTDALTRIEMAQTPESYRKFMQGYFARWRPEFEKYVEPVIRVRMSAEYPRYAKVSALTYQMVYDQSVRYDLPLIKMPTLWLIGQLDRTVFGRRFAPPESIKSMGNFPALGQEAASALPGARLIEFDELGHVAHLEAPDRFNAAVLGFLK
jgi:pimeloyl-ACP methyl ester carboxylesterase